MLAGTLQLTTGVALLTVRLTLALAVLYFLVFEGVKTVVKMCDPGESTVPAAGM
jgi:hypothetical protein